MLDTPVLLANSGIYMFPDSLATTPGSFVGIVLSSELPANDQETFKDLLTQLADLRIQVSLDHMCFSVFGKKEEEKKEMSGVETISLAIVHLLVKPNSVLLLTVNPALTFPFSLHCALQCRFYMHSTC